MIMTSPLNKDYYVLIGKKQLETYRISNKLNIEGFIEESTILYTYCNLCELKGKSIYIHKESPLGIALTTIINKKILIDISNTINYKDLEKYVISTIKNGDYSFINNLRTALINFEEKQYIPKSEIEYLYGNRFLKKLEQFIEIIRKKELNNEYDPRGVIYDGDFKIIDIRTNETSKNSSLNTKKRTRKKNSKTA